MAMDSRHVFTKSQIENLLNDCINRTVGEIDTKGVLSSGRYNKGYVGAVIEQSVLGYPADCDRRPDLLVDGSEVELKTTGIVKSRQQGVAYEAKEPMSITAVRPEEIVYEEFENSAFWEKGGGAEILDCVVAVFDYAMRPSSCRCRRMLIPYWVLMRSSRYQTM